MLLGVLTFAFLLNTNLEEMHGEANVKVTEKTAAFYLAEVDVELESNVGELPFVEEQSKDRCFVSDNVRVSVLPSSEYLHALTAQELNKLYAPFRAIVESIDTAYGLNVTIADPYCTEWGKKAVIGILETYTLEEFEKQLMEFAQFLLVGRLANHLRWLVNSEYDEGTISNETRAELTELITKNDVSLNNLMQIRDKLHRYLQLTHPYTIDLLYDIESIVNLLQDFYGIENRFLRND